jgi:prophage regulatory protein
MQTFDQEVLYRIRDVVRITGHGRSTVYRDVAAGFFPAPVRLGQQSVAWRKSDLDKWIAARPVVEPRRRASKTKAGAGGSAAGLDAERTHKHGQHTRTP